MIKKTFIIITALIFTSTSLFSDYYYSGGKKHTLKKMKSSRDANSKNVNSFETKHGMIVKVNRGIIISFSDKSIKKSIEQKYNLSFTKSLTDKMFLYKVQDSSKTIEIANHIYEEDGIEFCHPDFQRSKKSRNLTNDPYSWDLWHIYDHWQDDGGDVNIEQAWRYTKGAGVKVAVYDKGIDIDHPDLRENIYAFRNYNDSDTDVPYSNDDKNWHGTACAGIIAASENRIGGVGIAPEANLYAVGYSENNVSQDIEAYKWMMKEGVSIINNSWGSYSALDAYEEIFKLLATQGRDGKGMIIIFASGNEQTNLDNKDINDESESQYVLSIAASTRENSIASYSNYGSAIDFTAPGGTSASGIITTDARGQIGYSTNDYNKNFMGTSAAAPVAAGTVALMLAENPKLTREDVFKILKFTADKKGRYAYDSNGHNTHWGYGKINAGRAVALAHSYRNSNLKNFARTMFMELLN